MKLDDVRTGARAGAADPGVPCFAVVAMADGNLGVVVAGAAGVGIAGSEPVLRLTGRDVDGSTARVPEGSGSLEAAGLDGAPIDQRLDLRSGVTPGGSVYGTYVWSPCGAQWGRPGPEQRVKLGAGSQVMVAERGFIFQPANKH